MRSIKNNKKGFTIIEVLIVLAIAGVIMLVVFLAVPALQRNSRNTQRRNDVARIGGAITEWTQNNNGDIPVNTDVVDILDNAGTLAQYVDSDSISITNSLSGKVTDTGTIVIVTGAKCDTDDQGATEDGSDRQIAVKYALETGGGEDSVCQDI